MPADSIAIRIDRVQPTQMGRLMNLYIDLFHDREPLTRSVGLTRERMMEFAQAMYAAEEIGARSQQYCWLARAGAMQNSAVGFIFCDDPAAAGNEPALPGNLTDQEREQVSLMLSLLKAVRRPKQDQITAKAGKCLHIAAVGVSPEYEGHGIATRLLQAALADAAAQGFTHAFAECTSSASRRCHEKSGFRCLHTVDLSEFSARGVRRVPDNELELHLLWKDLADTP